MRNKIPVLLILAFTLSAKFASGQKSTVNSELTDPKDELAYMVADNKIPNTNIDYSTLYKVNFKAARDFMNKYPFANNVKWEILNDGYIASFVNNKVWKRNYYDKKGRWVHSIDRYDETKLQRDVRASVKSIYYDFAIFLVEEINVTSNLFNPVYLVHIKYNDIFKTIKVSNGELTEVSP